MPSRGRKPKIPWERELPRLVGERKKGVPYSRLAADLTSHYEIPVSATVVRQHVAPLLPSTKESLTATKDLDDRDCRLIAQHLARTSLADRSTIGRELGIPPSRVAELIPRAKTLIGGYVLPPRQGPRPRFSDQDMSDVLRTAAKESSTGSTISINQYDRWRKGLTDAKRKQAPTAVAFRRRFGTWTCAVRASGMTPTPLPHDYPGLSEDDLIVWVATWLRDIAIHSTHIVRATAATYAQWAYRTPGAPSVELTRVHFSWTELVHAAATMEKSVRKLPKPTPVQKRRPKKKC